jgi:hypothetical protein
MIGSLALVLIVVGGIFMWRLHDRGSCLAEGSVLVIGGLLTVVGIVLLMLETEFSAE